MPSDPPAAPALTLNLSHDHLLNLVSQVGDLLVVEQQRSGRLEGALREAERQILAAADTEALKTIRAALSKPGETTP